MHYLAIVADARRAKYLIVKVRRKRTIGYKLSHHGFNGPRIQEAGMIRHSSRQISGAARFAHHGARTISSGSSQLAIASGGGRQIHYD